MGRKGDWQRWALSRPQHWPFCLSVGDVDVDAMYDLL